MKLKKFMTINFILSIILIISLYLVSQLVKNYVEEDLLKFKRYSNLEKNSIKLVNLGSSHGKYGLYYQIDNYQKMNLARSSQNFYYDLQLLKKYQSKMDKKVVIIIPVSVFSFYNRFDESLEKTYIQILSKNKLLNINKVEYFLLKNFSVLYPPNNILKIKKKLKKEKYSKEYPNDLEMNFRIKESEETVLRHLGISEKKFLLKNAEQDFINLIKYIEDNDWRYVLITTPFLYLYNENIEKYQPGAFKERIYGNIKEVEKKLNKKFFYLDYSHDGRFENHLEYFFDDDHLNEKGAKYFTEILLEDLKRIGFNIE